MEKWPSWDEGGSKFEVVDFNQRKITFCPEGFNLNYRYTAGIPQYTYC